MLAEPERHGQRRVQEPEGRPLERGHSEPRPEVGAGIDREPADPSTEGHDSLDPEAQHAHLSAEQHAEVLEKISGPGARRAVRKASEGQASTGQDGLRSEYSAEMWRDQAITVR